MLKHTLPLFIIALASCSFLHSTLLYASPEVPGATQSSPIALTDCTIHTVSGSVIENGTIVFANGKITAIGKSIKIPANAKTIQLSGRHVYPGLIDSYTNMGLIEINAVRATRDEREAGNFNPNVRAEVAVNPDSEIIPTTRSNGVLLTLTNPSGGRLSGRSALIQLDGWTYEDLVVRANTAVHVNWPSIKSGEASKSLEELNEFFDRATRYVAAKQAGATLTHDARLDAMGDVLDGKVPLLVQADRLVQIQTAVAFSVQRKLRMILYGGYDAPRCAELLKQHNIPVIVGGVYRLPLRSDDPYDTPFTLPERLRKAGVTFCISGEGRMGASNARNLPYHAAMAEAFGLPHVEAIKAVTLYPAQILGVAEQVGSLDVGKDATMIITTGNPLETTTLTTAAYVQGRAVDLSDRHKRLWKKYQIRLQRDK